MTRSDGISLGMVASRLLPLPILKNGEWVGVRSGHESRVALCWVFADARPSLQTRQAPAVAVQPARLVLRVGLAAQGLDRGHVAPPHGGIDQLGVALIARPGKM